MVFGDRLDGAPSRERGLRPVSASVAHSRFSLVASSLVEEHVSDVGYDVDAEVAPVLVHRRRSDRWADRVEPLGGELGDRLPVRRDVVAAVERGEKLAARGLCVALGAVPGVPSTFAASGSGSRSSTTTYHRRPSSPPSRASVGSLLRVGIGRTPRFAARDDALGDLHPLDRDPLVQVAERVVGLGGWVAA